MIKNLLFLSVLSLIFIGCSNNKYPGFEKTHTGLYYKFIEKNEEGRKPQLEDHLRVNIKYTIGDSVLFDNYRQGTPHFLILSESKFKGDLQEGLSILSTGDSACFYIKADSFFIYTMRKQIVPKIARGDKDVKVELRIIQSFNKKDFQQEHLRNAVEARKNEPKRIKEYLSKHDIDITPTESGLYYIEKNAGAGNQPKEGDKIHVHFDVKLLDGTPVYSSRFRNSPYVYTMGTAFDVEGVIEALSMMRKGGKSTIIVPYKLGFGNKGKSLTIPPYSTLIYNIDLIDIQAQKETNQNQIKNQGNQENAREGMAYMIKKAGEAGIVKRNSGLLYEIIRKGKGPMPKVDDMVKVHYKGSLTDGRVFDQTNSNPAVFKVNGVIAGWTEVLQLMPVGSKYKVYIPNELAYHNRPPRGSIIEPYMPLVFEMELIEIVKK